METYEYEFIMNMTEYKDIYKKYRKEVPDKFVCFPCIIKIKEYQDMGRGGTWWENLTTIGIPRMLDSMEIDPYSYYLGYKRQY